MQSTWNLLEPSAGAALAEAHQRGWGDVVLSGAASSPGCDLPHGTRREVP